jgi:carotenoid 1,2-hydratase
VSDDGRHGLTVIAFVGSVFSPYYAFARRRGLVDPENHVAINVVLYGDAGHRWAMTERGRARLSRDLTRFQVHKSNLNWTGQHLDIHIDDVTVPLPSRLRGHIRLTAPALSDAGFSLDIHGRHIWAPLAPTARVEATFDAPALRWSGHGYFDMNYGAEPLEAAFRRWDWCRAPDGDGTVVFYDAERRDGGETNLALRIDAHGRCHRIAAPAREDLARTAWRVQRKARSEQTMPGVRTLEDTPFYARSLVPIMVGERELTAMHESLDLDRFRLPIVQMMLPFRMPRLR